VDSIYNGEPVAAAARNTGIAVEMVKRTDTRPGFEVLPKRWIVERSFGWTQHDRLPTRCYEHSFASEGGMDSDWLHPTDDAPPGRVISPHVPFERPLSLAARS
jgi:transposase